MASEWDLLAGEISYSPSNSGKHENEAVCNIKGRFTDLVVHLLEMRWKYQVWERCPHSSLVTNSGLS